MCICPMKYNIFISRKIIIRYSKYEQLKILKYENIFFHFGVDIICNPNNENLKVTQREVPSVEYIKWLNRRVK